MTKGWKFNVKNMNENYGKDSALKGVPLTVSGGMKENSSQILSQDELAILQCENTIRKNSKVGDSK